MIQISNPSLIKRRKKNLFKLKKMMMKEVTRFHRYVSKYEDPHNISLSMGSWAVIRGN